MVKAFAFFHGDPTVSRPCPQYPGASYRHTFRCSGRRYMLSPGYPEVADLMGYTLSIAANRHGILIHARPLEARWRRIDTSATCFTFPKRGRGSTLRRDILSSTHSVFRNSG